MNINADKIIELLEIKHSKDVFVSECKVGPSQGHMCPRMDGWAMRKSWANPSFIGYEVKVSRGDFVQDQKWRVYLKYCNQFYFVCPTGLIKKEELPNDTGLIYLSKTGSKLFIKKIAPHREVSIPVELFMYILMARTEITASQFTGYRGSENKLAWWKDWLAKKDENKIVGWNVSKKIQQLIEKRIDDVESKNAQLSEEISKLQEVKKLCGDLGIKLDMGWRFTQHLKDRIDMIKGKGYIDDIDNAIKNLTQIKESFNICEASGAIVP